MKGPQEARPALETKRAAKYRVRSCIHRVLPRKVECVSIRHHLCRSHESENVPEFKSQEAKSVLFSGPPWTPPFSLFACVRSIAPLA